MKPIQVPLPEPVFRWICARFTPATKCLTVELDGRVYKLHASRK